MDNAPETIAIRGVHIAVHRYNTIIVGTGAAGLNAAEYLHKHGQKDIALVTEGLALGTSRNTGSDKQTYYKLTLGGDAEDSVRKTAETLFNGGAMDGDIALAEAALSAQCFFRLVDLGVPFPNNPYGEYIGYKTDHDPVNRGTSCGPLTSKYMTERLLAAVTERGIPLFDRHQAIELLAQPDENGGKRAVGVLALNLDALDNPDTRYVLFAAQNVIYATGGEAGMYEACVYPPSQTGSTGVALRAGVKGKNLTESQYGIGSIKFRWNLSGTYQQVLPRYVSTDQNGEDEREFMNPYFPDDEKLLAAIFLKGYQWPFDPRKIADHGSSLIDILVYHEIMFKNRRVFLDYRRNPSRAETGGMMDFGKLVPEVREYLENSGALLPTPIERLGHMNPKAIDLYAENGIDLASELLEIAVCAQHNNGGLSADKWWQSNILRFFPVGEVNGSHGVYRPGGSALNSGQVGGVRAAQYILARSMGDAPTGDALASACGAQLESAISFGEDALARGASTDLTAERADIRRRMSLHGAHIRSAEGARTGLREAREQLEKLNGAGIGKPSHLRSLHQLRDLAVCGIAYLAAIGNYIEQGGKSRGSYLIHDASGQKPEPSLPDVFSFALDTDGRATRIQETEYAGGDCGFVWREVRPMPSGNDWFENVWKSCLAGENFD